MVKQDVLLDLLPEGGWIDLHKPRLTPLKNEELTLYQRFLLFLMLKVGKARCPNIFRTMFRNLRVYFPFARFNATVMPKGELSRRHTELAILRMPHRRAPAARGSPCGARRAWPRGSPRLPRTPR